ncbi:MAG: secondary thiamine-phosphate synthase enzyme YjbQ [Candidatus Pacearchaeota archaeon]|nr:secondary thiamine-phosphate synthase enzyme YjbQ [Candidatus Pacearchaeota archaeon]
MISLEIKTKKREELIDITEEIQEKIKKRIKIKEGMCLLYVPSTTAAITINEGYDPRVKKDILTFLKKNVPRGCWSHDIEEKNADAHIKSSLIGCFVVIPIYNNSLQLGTWQRIFFCEFDGPRERKILIFCIKNE